tara:strand:+ start:2715 stop:3668 length:954 start_codon:yes stop_codon:yes gene_type:complete
MNQKLIFTFLLIITLIQAQEIINFKSANPFSFNDIITDFSNHEEQDVSGVLRLPDNIDNKVFPLVIGVAGSKGWGEHHLEYLKLYRDMGIATFELESFKSRDVSSTVGSQVEVTHAMMILDSYRALEALSNHPNIDIDNVAITGWSLGGGVSLFSGWLPLKKAIGIDLTFAAHLPIYPPCFVTPEILDFTDSPIHILIGELDNWVPAAACIDLVSELQNVGTNIDITVYDGAHHSFDRSTPVIKVDDAYSFTDCRLKMNAEGSVLMNYWNIPMTSPWLQKIGMYFCAERGPFMGGHPESKKKAHLFASNFMKKYLLD